MITKQCFLLLPKVCLCFKVRRWPIGSPAMCLLISMDLLLIYFTCFYFQVMLRWKSSFQHYKNMKNPCSKAISQMEHHNSIQVLFFSIVKIFLNTGLSFLLLALSFLFNYSQPPKDHSQYKIVSMGGKDSKTCISEWIMENIYLDI